MLSLNPQNLPLITIGVVVFNREWIIKRMLASVQSQTYPHDKLFVVVVDGQSKDNTAKIAEEILSQSDFGGFKVIVKDSNIPEARNICIQNLQGDYLLFWDSDVIMEPTAVSCMLETLRREEADMVAVKIPEVFVDSVDEVDVKWSEWQAKVQRGDKCVDSPAVGTGFSLIAKSILGRVAFDPDYTFYEDQDFSLRAKQQGFKILLTQSIVGFDVNSDRQQYSDIYAFDMPLKKALRGIRKKGIIQAKNVTSGCPSIGKAVTRFFLANKRYLFYAGYLPALILAVIGVVLQNLWLSLVFPAYFAVYAILQFKKRGFGRGLNAAARSVIVGVPSTYALLYYCMKLSFKR